ncbi:hypothetical protein HaLaN_15345 [Haematococcus lacustris]|uniref:Uncharacterized protein n=1 Tax=Haematococcus lacustris TaxID=44745 RepID=A0A699Z7C8_HAELA|nr:hypothetical protein HaLaN_15345 [Haematococcus lacustris]
MPCRRRIGHDAIGSCNFTSRTKRSCLHWLLLGFGRHSLRAFSLAVSFEHQFQKLSAVAWTATAAAYEAGPSAGERVLLSCNCKTVWRGWGAWEGGLLNDTVAGEQLEVAIQFVFRHAPLVLTCTFATALFTRTLFRQHPFLSATGCVFSRCLQTRCLHLPSMQGPLQVVPAFRIRSTELPGCMRAPRCTAAPRCVHDSGEVHGSLQLHGIPQGCTLPLHFQLLTLPLAMQATGKAAQPAAPADGPTGRASQGQEYSTDTSCSC